MGKVHNGIFAGIVSLFLFCVIAVCAAGVLLPGFQIPQVLMLEGDKVTTYDDLKGKSLRKSVMNGKFQKKAEKYISDRLPMHDDTLLVHAKLQRMGIRSAAALFDYPAYPTYFGSNKIVDSECGVITVLSKKARKSPEANDALIQIINDSYEKHPDVHYIVDWVMKDNFSSYNPTYQLRYSPELVNEDWVVENNVKPLNDGIKAFVDTLYTSNVEEPIFPCDSHWTLPRALETYDKVGSQLGWKEVDWNTLETYEAVPVWYGTRARAGLDTDYPNATIDDTNTFSHLEFFNISTGEPLSASAQGLRSVVLSGEATETQMETLKYSGYSAYYGSANEEIVNHGANNGRKLLMVGDSYTHSLVRYFADNYERTVCILPGNTHIDGTLDEYIDKYEVDDVVFMMHPLKADIIAKNSPDFLNGAHAGDDIDEGE